MFARLCVVILSVAALLCVLLAQRHQRLQCASELTQARLRIRDADEKLWRLRGVIADRVTPAQIQVLAAASGLGPLSPATNDPSPALAKLFAPPTQTPLQPKPKPKPAAPETYRPSRIAGTPDRAQPR